jgi:hypothetical protein
VGKSKIGDERFVAELAVRVDELVSLVTLLAAIVLDEKPVSERQREVIRKMVESVSDKRS